MVGSDVVGEIDGDTVGDVVGSEVVGETDGDTVGSEVVGEIDGVTVGSDVVGETDGDVVGSEVVGEIDGDAVGSEVVGEIDGDADGSEVVGEIDGDVVGSDDDDDDDWINTGMGVGGGAPLVGRRSKRARTAVVGTRYTDTASTSSDRDPADADHVQRSALRQEERAGRKRHLAGIKAAMMEATIVFLGGGGYNRRFTSPFPLTLSPSHSPHLPHAPCAVLYLAALLIGCQSVLAIRCRDRSTSSGVGPGCRKPESGKQVRAATYRVLRPCAATMVCCACRLTMA